MIDGETKYILDFKLSPCSECHYLSFGWFPGVWILCADVSEHSVCSIFICGVSKEKFFLLTPHMKTEHIKCSQKLAHFSVSRKKFFLLTLPVKMEQCSEKSAQKIQTPGHYRKGRIKLSTCLWPANRGKEKITTYKYETNPLNMWSIQIFGNETNKSIWQAWRN